MLSRTQADVSVDEDGQRRVPAGLLRRDSPGNEIVPLQCSRTCGLYSLSDILNDR